jgi:autophagy-related protein 17
MSSPTARGEQPDLISLVHQSRKALQQGEALCSRANATSTSSAKEATDVLALNAKIQWITNAVIEQLKACPTSSNSTALLTRIYVARCSSGKVNRGAAGQA